MRRRVCVSFDHDSCFLACINEHRLVFRGPLAAEDLPESIKQGKCSFHTRGVLASRDYQLFRAKKPAVSSAEMREALLWQEQEHFLVPADQLIIEYFGCHTHDSEVYVVAIPKPILQRRYDVLLAAGLNVQNLTIPEFVYADYIRTYLSTQPLVAWVQWFADHAQVLCYWQGNLVANMRLPKEVHELQRSLQLFYLDHLRSFQETVCWLIHSHDAQLHTELTPVLQGEVKPLLFSDLGIEQDDIALQNSAMNHAIVGAITAL